MGHVRGRITILVDNIVPGRSEALGEHGFSAHIETNRGDFLFDTGKGRALAHNALLFQRDLSKLEEILLSHSHGDHTGGLPDVLLIRAKSPVHVRAHPDIFVERYRAKDGKKSYGGIPYTRGYLEKMGARFVFNRGYTEIQDGIYLTGEIPRETPFEGGDMGNRFALREGKEVPDILLDDQSVVLHTEKGLVIVLGCAHSGMINVINHAIRMSGIDSIYAIVGGTHLEFSGETQLKETIEALRTYDIHHLIPSHCTGPEALMRLRDELGGVFQFSHVGLRLEF
ncbi:MAG: MBL fold metallo-hydrolase [Deltaproteobacteria bacterium]|nr:MBL fold metallo-hydrolase [Deltaproteobacteria bacterium]MBW2137537.1 MBL fold metallo-hydrolase [Deltaproteobacteria bacterium]